MISFIIIGRNESWKLTKCIESIINAISANKLKYFEIVYIDSDSDDDSIDRAKKFDDLKVIKIKGDINAAVARNIGAENTKGDVIFFIDGDMEIMPSFLKLVYSEEKGLINDFVSGNWINYFYDSNDKFLEKKPFLNIQEDRFETTTGGLFLILRSKWELVNGMNNRFKKSQDIDLGLRLSKRNIFLLRKKEIGAHHHSIAYHNKERIWKELFGGKHLYGRSFLYRVHLFNKRMYKRLLRNDYSLILFIICLITSIITGFYQCFLIYLFLIIYRSKLQIKMIVYFILRDLIVLFGFFLFYPKKTFDIKIEQI